MKPRIAQVDMNSAKVDCPAPWNSLGGSEPGRLYFTTEPSPGAAHFTTMFTRRPGTWMT